MVSVVLQQQGDQILGVEAGVDDVEVKLDPEQLGGVDLAVGLPVQEVVLVVDNTLTRVIICRHPDCVKIDLIRHLILGDDLRFRCQILGKVGEDVSDSSN